MLRNKFLAVLAVLAVAASSQAAVMVTSDAGTAISGLPGYKQFIVTATSDVVGETITGVDFFGSNATPAEMLGFSGSLNQVNPAGFATIFQDVNAFFGPTPVTHDSQFMFRTNAMNANDVNSPSGFSGESSTSLRALFSRASGFGQQVALAQLAIPDAAATVAFKGKFSVLRGGVNTTLPEVTGTVGGGTPVVPPNVVLNALGQREISAGLITGALNATGDVPINWTNLTQTGGPPVAVAATLSGTNNGTFNWNPAGSKAGKKGSGNVLYSWTATATNAGGSDTDVAITVILIPEPATMALFGFAAIGVVVFIRRRSL